MRYVGNDRQMCSYLARQFELTSVSTRPGPWRVVLSPRHLCSDAEVLAFEIPRHRAAVWRAAGYLIVPRWLYLTVDLRHDFESRFHPKLHSRVRRIERLGLHCEQADDAASIGQFWREMYVPYASRQHADLAVTLRLRFVRNLVRHGAVLFVAVGKRRIAGSLVQWLPHPSRSARLRVTGIAESHLDAIPQGVREALYLFPMRWAKERGARYLDLTTAYPFLSDGLLRHKMQWGADWHLADRDARCLAVKARSQRSVETLRRLGLIHESRPGCVEPLA